jgi:hypothetical protein
MRKLLVVHRLLEPRSASPSGSRDGDGYSEEARQLAEVTARG